MSYFEFCGVSCRAAFLTPFGGKIFLFYVFTGILFSVQPPAAISFLYYVFTSRVLHNTTSGGSIFRCTTKDRGERRAKGVATPFNPPELMRDRKPDVLWLYLLATVRLTRLSRLRRCRLSPCLGVLHCSEKQQDLRNHLTADFSKRRLFNECYEPIAVGAVQQSPAEAVLSAMKLPKKGGAWLSGEAA